MIRDFSKRHGFEPRPAKLTREGNSDALQSFVLRHLSQSAHGSEIHTVRELVSKTLNYVPNPGNQMIADIWGEIEHAVRRCPWFMLYNLIEELYRLRGNWGQKEFTDEVNSFFEDENFGWQLRAVPLDDFGGVLTAPEIVIRGDEAFEETVARGVNCLRESGMTNATTELHEAIADLSRRPGPDLTGAVHHSIAALECATAESCGEPGKTLGEIVKRNPAKFPAPLGEAVSKLYGFASDRGRHVSEGRAPTVAQAEFVVRMSAALIALVLNP